MKLFLLFLALIAFTAAEPSVRKSKAEVDQILAACFKRFNIPEEVLAKSRRSKIPPIEVFEVALCSFRDMGAWSDSTGFNLNVIMQLTPEDFPLKQKLGDALKNCLDAKREEDTPLSWAYRNFRCFDILTSPNASTEIAEH